MKIVSLLYDSESVSQGEEQCSGFEIVHGYAVIDCHVSLFIHAEYITFLCAIIKGDIRRIHLRSGESCIIPEVQCNPRGTSIQYRSDAQGE